MLNEATWWLNRYCRMSELMESAWEREEDATMLCEAIGCDVLGAKWRLKGMFDAQGDWLPGWREYPGDRWVCDAHKVEPQPPSYTDWLAAQEIK